MTFYALLDKQITSTRARQLTLVIVSTIITFSAFETLSFLTGIYQIRTFVNIALLYYFGLVAFTGFVFDLRLKPMPGLKKSEKDLRHFSQRIVWAWEDFVSASKIRFHYLFSWEQWRHYFNYLILPGILYWSVVALIFLHPFLSINKQAFSIVGTVLVSIAIWYMKTIFTNYDRASVQLRYLMLTVTVFTAFLAFSAALGLAWYFGLSASWYAVTVLAAGSLLMYQSAFQRRMVTLRSLKYIVSGGIGIYFASSVVFLYWSVNFYSAGLLLGGLLYFYWSVVLQYLQKRLTKKMFLEYLLIFIFILIFVLTTTNFGARIS